MPCEQGGTVLPDGSPFFVGCFLVSLLLPSMKHGGRPYGTSSMRQSCRVLRP